MSGPIARGVAGLGGRVMPVRLLAAAAAMCAIVAGPASGTVVATGSTEATEASVSLRIDDSEFELLPMQRLFRNDESRGASFKAAVPTTNYFGHVSVSSSQTTTPAITYSVEGQPDKESYQFCSYKTEVCEDVQIGVEEASGHLFLHIDAFRRQDGLSPLPAHVEDFLAQPVELSAVETGTGRKIYRDVVIQLSSRVPDCGDYNSGTPELFACLMLGEYLPDEPPATTTAIRDALPDSLVQPKANYSLVFAEEFDGSKSPWPTGDCMTALTTITTFFSVKTEPCTHFDGNNDNPVPCEEIENGYYYTTKTKTCGSQIGTHGKFNFKYGYIEVKYEIERARTNSGYINHAVATIFRNMLAHSHQRYGITIDTEEDLLRYEENELDIIEFVSTAIPRIDISHMYYNTHQHLSGHSSVRTNQALHFCSSTETYAILINPPGCRQSGTTFVVTRGLEWTPKGIVNYVMVEDDPNYSSSLHPFKKSNYQLQYGTSRGWEHGLICGTDRDRYLVPIDSTSTETDPAVFAQVAVGHLPLPLGIVTHGSSPPVSATNRLRIHHIRVFQPANRYTDMEPVFPPLPLTQPVVSPVPTCQPFQV